MKNEEYVIDLDSELITPEKENKKKKIIPIIIILIIALLITGVFAFLHSKKEPVVIPETTQASEWEDKYVADKQSQYDKYPDVSLPPVTVD
ncbi:MAG: hypothetical protein ACI37Z_10365 [Candidatus Gastranaerophilaceae bacterium]